MKKRRYTDQDIIEAVKISFSIAQVLKILHLSPTGCNYKAMHANCVRLCLDTSHLTGQGHLKGKHHSWSPARPLSELLIRNSPCVGTTHLKRRLLKEKLLTNQCRECGTLPLWQGKPLVLILDHSNGDRSDNRIENLRLLCPNCNSQQATFAGRNRGKYPLHPQPGPALDICKSADEGFLDEEALLGPLFKDPATRAAN